MAERNAIDILNLRLPLYAYTAPLWQGRRVLEIGCEEGDSAAYLASHGASQVVVIDTDVARIERARVDFPHPNVDYRPAADLRQMAAPHEAFDLVVIPEGKSLVANRNLLTVLRRVLSPSGHLLISVPAADRRTPAFNEGLGYYELVDALEAQFKVVRMLGRTPFLGFGLVEFDGSADALRLDATLLRGATEAPSHYIAVAGATPPPPLGYALVQVPFAPIEARLIQASEPARAGEAEETARRLAAERTQQASEIGQLRRQLEEARQASRGAPGAGVVMKAAVSVPGTLDPGAARAELAERRLDEVERRGRTRLDEADTRFTELRRKLEEALVQSESAVRVSRIQGDEIEELRGRLRRAAEDRATGDLELAKLRRALAEADESVLMLTRKTAEEMTAVAQRIAVGLRAPSNDPGGGPRERHAEVGALREEIERLRAQLAAAEVRPAPRDGEGARPGAEARVREAEESAARARAELADLGARLRAADAHIRALEPRAAGLVERDERIALFDGERQHLLSRVSTLEDELRSRDGQHSRTHASGPPAALARDKRDVAIEEFHRLAAAHVGEVHGLLSALDEQAAQVVELEDALRVVEGRATAAEKDAAVLRRNAKALEDADRARRGRLSELEGKLLRLEREKSTGGAGVSAGDMVGSLALEEARQRLASMEQRALAGEQRAVGLEEQRRAADERAAAAEARARSAESRALANAAQVISVTSPVAQNGTHAAPATVEVQSAIEEIEEQLRHELRMLGAIEETLARARDEMTQARGGGPSAELEQALAAKDAQLVEGRLELTRLRREAETRQSHLEREVSELRTRLDPLGQIREDQSQSTQLILMHTTLANIRRRAARLRDELEGFRRRLDSIPAGALSSLLEEIGEDLSEFAR